MATSRMPSAKSLRLQIAAGQISAEEPIRRCIAAIEASDHAIGAWTSVLPRAEICAPQGEKDDLGAFPLFGVPIGVKDNIATRTFATEYGSPIYRAHRPATDAACISSIEAAGGVIIGKTALAEFAVRRPCATRNPLDLRRTPGGSSSGSAAAVAAGMVPLAVGTQTGGSIIRPAAYCGIYAIKPTFGIVNRGGVRVLSDSADTVGFFAKALDDLALVLGAVTRDDALTRVAFEGLDSVASGVRLAFCRTPQWQAATSPMQQCLLDAAKIAARTEATLIDLGSNFDNLDAASDVVTEFETWQSLGYERAVHAGECSPQLIEVLEKGRSHTYDEYISSQKRLEVARIRIDSMFANFDCIVAPSAPDEALIGLNDTGPSTFNKMWTLLHVPCVNVPAGRGPAGLPLGLQVIAARHNDTTALAGARKLSLMIGTRDG